MDKSVGTLSIYLLMFYRDLDTCKDAQAKSCVYRAHGVTQQQAKGLVADFRGMNQHMKDLLYTTWCTSV